MKKILFVLAVALLCAGCSETDTVSGGENTYADTNQDTRIIVLNKDTATIDGKEIEQTDYTWHVDYTAVHDDVENAPAEYYTGTKSDADIYIDHELYYYPDFGLDNYELITYDGEKEYALYYRDGSNDGYIFATLPNLSKDVISQMLHTEDEAAENKVLHIKSGGTYILEGEWKGQINIDIPDDETVTVILNGINVECTVAPGIIFENAYECGSEYSDGFNTDGAGVTVVLNKDTENTVTGCNVYRMLSTKYKDEDTKVQKKMRKYDAAFYSAVTMNIEGEGSLTVNSNFEGLDTEMHLTVKGGNITINSIDDGINVNEDDVSVVSFTGGNVTVNHSSGSEGDGVDSNGYIVIDGGTVNINGVFSPDSALDSDCSIYYTNGEIYIDGKLSDKEPGTYREISAYGSGFGKGGFPPGSRPNKGEKEPPADAAKDFNGERPRRRFDESQSAENTDLTD